MRTARAFGLTSSLILGLGLVTGSAGALPGASPTTLGDWTQFHFGPDHLGYNPYETVLSPATVPSLTETWTASIGTPAGMAVADGVVYATADGLGDVPRGLYALDAASGQVVWSLDLGRQASAPAVDGGRVFVAHKMCRNRPQHCSRKLIALDALTGALAWKTILPGYQDSAPTVVGGVIYLSSNLYVLALDESTGEILWHADITSDSTPESPSVLNGVVYQAVSGTVYAFDAASGTMLWTQSIADTLTGSVVVAGNVLFVESSATADVYALDSATGTQLWRDDSPPGFSFAATTPAVGEGMVFEAAGNGGMMAFDASGNLNCGGAPKVCQPIWVSTAAPGSTNASPAAANGVLYGNAVAFDAATGAVLWSGFASFDTTPPVVSQGVLYAGGQGNLHAYAP